MVVLILRDCGDQVTLDVHAAVLEMLKLGDIAEGARDLSPFGLVEALG